ncbi:MAG: tetratricopeptide repeat protein [Bryobacterales bacterium]|nr:tetratricopeptide repeat protein [Bryobacterales bacterium]
MLERMQILLLLAAAAVADSDALGRTAFAAGNYRQALIHFERALRTAEPADRAAVLSNASQASIALDELHAAETYTRLALEVEPKRAALWQQLGQIYLLRGKLDQARASLERARIIGESPAILADLGVLAQRRKRPAEAIQLFRRAADLLPPGQPRARILANLGDALAATGQLDQGIEALRAALNETPGEHPDRERILESYAGALARVGRKKESKAAAAEADRIRSAFRSNHAAVSAAELRR